MPAKTTSFHRLFVPLDASITCAYDPNPRLLELMRFEDSPCFVGHRGLGGRGDSTRLGEVFACGRRQRGRTAVLSTQSVVEGSSPQRGDV